MSKKPETLNIRIDAETKKLLQECADTDGRSLSSYCALVLDKHVKKIACK